MRVTSQIWVDAYLRRINFEGNFGCVVKRGAEGAGAIFIILNHLDGLFSLFGPAPQAILADHDGPADRMFSEVISHQPESTVLDRLEREKNFDPDLWIIENEDRKGRPFLDLVSE